MVSTRAARVNPVRNIKSPFLQIDNGKNFRYHQKSGPKGSNNGRNFR